MRLSKIYRSFLPVALLFAACTKSKTDHLSGNLPTTQPMPSSAARIVNLGGSQFFPFTELVINGKKLTSFLPPAIDGTPALPLPTPYFPSTGILGTTYLIPQQFIGANDSASVKLGVAIGNGSSEFSLDSFSVRSDYYHPIDYYMIFSRTANGGSYSSYDSLVRVPRAVSPAADPTHILVRLLNLSSAPDDANITGPMRLVYADGIHVAAGAADTLVSPNNMSGYFELPYGTYQLKVLTADGTQVPGVGVNIDAPMVMQNQYTAVMDGSALTYAPVLSFQPGGVYTVVVSCNHHFNYPYGSGAIENNYNSFRVITDIAAAANITYTRLQAANAVPGASLNVLVDGAALSSGLDYDSVGGYKVFVAGTHTISVQDASGKQLARKTVDLPGNTNFTVWAFPSGTGADLLLAGNNLSGNRNNTYYADGSDAGANTINTSFPFLIRFLNLCPDLPYVTFTQASGNLFGDNYFSAALAAQNLPFGGQLSSSTVPYPYVGTWVIGGRMPSQIQVYQSASGIVPGNWLSDIPALKDVDFNRMPAAFYPAGVPSGEPGVYTVALTGRYGANVPAGQAAKLIIVKHTK